MYRFAKAAALALVCVLGAGLAARAQEEVTAPGGSVHAETYAVSVNGVDVSEKSILYIADDGTMYASAADLAAWKLRYPSEPAFMRGGRGYYALQSTLRLAVAVAHPQERVEIIAPRSAFIGQPRHVREPLTPGRGMLLNYRVRRTNGTYNLFDAHNSSALQVQYESVQSSRGIAFLRAQTRWYRLDLNKHNVLQLGDGEVDGGTIGSSLSFAGVHFASAYTQDPLFNTNALPTVRGIAATPSLVEVYVNDVLQWREEVPAGPFTVRDLPASAANSDVLLVLYDRYGNRTVQVVRPFVDQQFLRPGLTSYSVDAGIGRVGGAQSGAYYRDAVFSATLRHGITPAFTAQLQAQSIAGKAFGAAGLQLRISRGQYANVSYGAGTMRRAGQVSYRLRVRRFEFGELLRFNAERTASEYDPFGFYAQFNESTDVRYDTGGAISLGLRLDRSVSNSGFATSMISMDTSARIGDFSLQLRPVYDNAAHRLSATVDVSRRIGNVHDVTQRAEAPANGPASLAMEYRKSQRDPDDPFTFDVRAVAAGSAERRLYAEDRLPWGVASVLVQKQYGRGLVEPEVSGSLAMVGGRVYPMRGTGGEETIGVVHLPRLPNVRVNVNGVDAGRTNKQGDLVLRNLSALANNVVTADLSNVPISYEVKDPEVLVPYTGTPVDLNLLRVSAQSVELRVVDAAGMPLPPGTWFAAGNGVKFPIGFNGRAFIQGLPPGVHTFTAQASPRCAFTISIAARFQIVDAGTRVCR